MTQYELCTPTSAPVYCSAGFLTPCFYALIIPVLNFLSYSLVGFLVICETAVLHGCSRVMPVHRGQYGIAHPTAISLHKGNASADYCILNRIIVQTSYFRHTFSYERFSF